VTENAKSTTAGSKVLACAAWIVTTSLAVVAVLRIFYHDGSHFLIWLNAFTRYVYLPAYACILVGMWQRRRRLSSLAAAVIACHLYWIAPDFLRDRRFDIASAATSSATSDAGSLRIFFANVCYLNTQYEEMMREIADAEPDVVVFVEFSPQWYAAFRASGIAGKFPYDNGQPPSVSGVNVFSKRPLKSSTQKWFADRGVATIEVPMGAETLRIVGLHAPRPMDFRRDDYEGFWKGVMPLLVGEQHPLVVVGDFNATQYSRVCQDLKRGGLRSAHEDRGRGLATTWPNGTLPVPPIRIDQAFLSPDVECVGIREGEGLGSDHKPLVLEVRLRP
jgi:endonuclease/exonuclease/phosphatase (EEP) superfamily protein YafD